MKKLTQEEFIEKAREIHGDKYDYSLVEYKNYLTNVKIICPIHGVFEQTPNSHLYSNGCPECSIENKCGSNRRGSTEIFIKRSRKIHGDKYDYSLVDYKNSHSNVKIICPIHGVFEQTPNSHLSGKGCLKCGKENRQSDLEAEYIKQARKIHGDKYDYSLVKYKNAKTNVKIICPIHGVFEQSLYQHSHGNGCPKCLGRNKTTEEFIKQARKIHGDKYDYSLVKYKNAKINVKIICPIHGVFEQTPERHLNGSGCRKCVKNQSKTTEEFIKQAKKIHGDKYDYSLVDYKNNHSNVKIICPIHGVFEQSPRVHLCGCGCKKCKNEYKSEKDIENILKQKNIIYTHQKKFNWLKDKKKMSLDFYIPKYNVAIECQGIQHFTSVGIFGGDKKYKYTIDHDKKKRELCEQHGIKILYYTRYKYKFPYKVYTNPEELINDIKKIDPI